jgi:NADPH-dependent curcumin reductase CurA
MKGFALGEVVFSKSQVHKTGDLVMGLFGWERYTMIH